MKTLQILGDKAAISLSALCALHCLAVPLLFTLLPSLSALPLGSEAFHIWMVAAVIPTSLYALTLGCRRHHRYYVLAIGGAGLACLILALVLANTVFHDSSYRELLEKSMTTVGSLLIALGHLKNYWLCRSDENCECPENDQQEKLS